MKRRRLLATVGATSVSLAGCIGTDMPHDAVVRAVQKSPPEDVALVSYDDLPKSEQQIARTAVEEDFYHACPELPEAVRSFAERFEGQTAPIWSINECVTPCGFELRARFGQEPPHLQTPTLPVASSDWRFDSDDRSCKLWVPPSRYLVPIEMLAHSLASVCPDRPK